MDIDPRPTAHQVIGIRPDWKHVTVARVRRMQLMDQLPVVAPLAMIGPIPSTVFTCTEILLRFRKLRISNVKRIQYLPVPNSTMQPMFKLSCSCVSH